MKMQRATSGALLLAIAYLGFISLGLPDPVAGVAWPSVREAFELPQSGFGLLFIALGCGYCVSGFFGGKLTQLLGLGNLLWISSALVAVAMFGSALAPSWAAFIACGAVWGLGSGGIDAGLNAYGSRAFSSRHMNWLHACYSIGATIGPLLMTAVLVSAGSYKSGYAIVGGLLAAMTALFLVTRRRWSLPQATGKDSDAAAHVGIGAALKNRLVWLQVVMFFLYVGLEFTVGQWSFTLFTESRGMDAETAGVLAGGYYAAIGVGRVIAGLISASVGLDRLLRATKLIALCGVAMMLVKAPVAIGAGGLLVLGLGLAPIFPSLMARTPQRVGVGVAAHAIGFQVSAGMIGAALMPGAAGLLAERLGLESIAWFALLLAALLLATHEALLYAGRPTATAA
jgi:fucose permease